MGLTLVIASHPLLEIGAFVTRFVHPLAELAAPGTFDELLGPAARPPLESSEDVRAEIRRLLRHGGFKPAGRNKPASEYLQAAHAERRFPRINAAVDACNVASLWSGLPISLVDLDRTTGPLEVRIAPAGTTHVFNPSGQVIDAGGLLCVWDAEGATGTPVKDAQRTKTHDGTRVTLSVVWGTRGLPGRTAEATAWYRALVGEIAGAALEDVICIAEPC
jgi:DNA/RNA-binding domain of Phe-tRNA-synthetase-like protein